ASALYLLTGRDPDENQSHSNPELSAAASKPDFSTLQRIGHFYFALTALRKISEIADLACSHQRA
ncbi:MAG TPA: hypothetical protein VH325_00625, partial [Bryobacteraceae bacterium]|nr:hypothetical protein [Bryobacteraceae bacterium]